MKEQLSFVRSWDVTLAARFFHSTVITEIKIRISLMKSMHIKLVSVCIMMFGENVAEDVMEGKLEEFANIVKM